MRIVAMIAICVATALASGCKQKNSVPIATQAVVDSRNTNYRPGDGVIVNTARAGKRVAALNDFDQLRTFIFAFELDNNRMPTKEEIRTDLQKDAQNLLKLIDEGAILFPAILTKQGLWAYEVDSDKAGGIVITAGNVSRATKDEVKALLAQN